MKRLLLLAAAATALACRAADATLPARDLRGYGRTSAEKTGDRVVLTCADAAKALLWAARYDHVYAAYRVRPGVYRLPGGGWTRLLPEGRRLEIAYSAAEPKGALAAPLPSVPMYLNEYDDFAFRFYYREHETPRRADGQGNVPWSDYDPVPEFDFAKGSGSSGLVFWDGAHFCDTAKGFCRSGGWDWAKELADARGLPVVLNTSLAVPMWAMDAARAENETKAPGFVGSYHSVGEPFHAGEGFLSWASTGMRQRLLDDLAKCSLDHGGTNVVNLLEPHGELNHGDYTCFTEYGPLVDASFREMLAERYGTPAAVARRWQDPSVRSWSDVHLPEVAAFAGYGPKAVDLAGAWDVRDAGTTNAWGRLRMPGHDVGLFLSRRPRELRRRFDLPARPAGARTWLYVWDLSQTFRQRVRATLNGRLVADEAVQHAVSHWMVREVTDDLRAGANELLLEVPDGKIAYKVYLTHEEPKAYPHFPRGQNARWVDFCDWQEWSRLRAVKQGLDTLRSVEPDKTIVAMAPGAYFNGMRELAGEYGTRFHDTGSMAAFWWEMLPMLMRSKGLPFSLEPGGPAQDVAGFRRMTSFYLSEGVNAIHYFIHVGCVFWDDAIRAEFERRLPALKMLGRCAPDDTEMAMLVDSRVNARLGYPWRQDVASAYPGGYMHWRFAAALGGAYQMDAVTPHDFADGNAGRYRYLLDANNTVMDAETVAGIERYVRAGGTYVAMFQSGRHAPEVPERWVLGPLAGVSLARLSTYARVPDAHGVPSIRLMDGKRRVEVVPENGVYPAAGAFPSDGAAFRPEAADVRVLWRWEDGTAAVTVRPVGKGRVVVFGLRPDNIYNAHEFRILETLLGALGARPKTLDATCGRGFGRQYRTTDGLRDVWFADAGDQPGPYALRFRDGKARRLTDVLTGRELPREGVLEANGFVMGTSPRDDEAEAAWHWVRNQFGWWRGGGRKQAPAGSDVAHAGPAGHADILDLSDMLGGPKADVSYSVRRRFTVPADWTGGAIELWAVGMYAGLFTRGALDVDLNGRRLLSGSRSGVAGLRLDLRPGETAELALSVTGDRNPSVHGFGGPVYLLHRPDRRTLLDLSGDWEAYADYADAAPRAVVLPGRVDRCVMLRKVVTLPKDFAAGGPVRLLFTGRGDRSGGVVVNGHYLRRHHHMFGDGTDLDVTPWIRRGAENEILLVHVMPGDHFELKDLRLAQEQAPAATKKTGREKKR